MYVCVYVCLCADLTELVIEASFSFGMSLSAITLSIIRKSGSICAKFKVVSSPLFYNMFLVSYVLKWHNMFAPSAVFFPDDSEIGVKALCVSGRRLSVCSVP